LNICHIADFDLAVGYRLENGREMAGGSRPACMFLKVWGDEEAWPGVEKSFNAQDHWTNGKPCLDPVVHGGRLDSAKAEHVACSVRKSRPTKFPFCFLPDALSFLDS
jgi:hypothetical protein